MSPVNPVGALSIRIKRCVCSKYETALGLVAPGTSNSVTKTTFTCFAAVTCMCSKALMYYDNLYLSFKSAG